ncbi:MAG: LCP family protein [Nitriliruptorales bacterium]|nr:LCP family protein [Nitriliruptorales bacterium]
MTDSTLEPGLWGPTIVGGRRLRGWRRALTWVVAAASVAILVVGLGAALLVRTAEANLTRVPVGALETIEPGRPINVLVAGSDARSGLTAEEIRRYNLGDFSGQRSDTVILVSVTPDHDGVSVVHFPRDLYVVDQDTPRKLTETFAGGPDALVDVVQSNFNVPVHHYVEVSVTGFISVVDALGAVEICLEEPLRDRKSGADFTAGCHQMDPAEALSFVRSRAGPRGDFERIERQQQFLKAMLDELVAARTFVDLPRLFSVVEKVAANVSTDQDLGLNRMRSLANELRGLASGDIPMTFVPGYTQTINGKSYVIPYRPGATALFEAIRDGEVLAPRGTRQQREQVEVALWTAGLTTEAVIIESTLNWAGFRPVPDGVGPIDGGAETAVYARTVTDLEAGWVAATLGVDVSALPPDLELPDGVDVVVVAGRDAAPRADS